MTKCGICIDRKPCNFAGCPEDLVVKSRIVIGDVHGSYKTLMALVAQLPAGVPITFAGDLIDRGPDSRKVVQFVIENGHDCVLGNHEKMMIEHITQTAATQYMNQWTNFTANGGMNTLNSYANFPEDIEFHTQWMKGLPLFIEYPEIKNEGGRYLVVSHSGVGRVWHWDEKKRQERGGMFEQIILWDRGQLVDQSSIYNIFGHTPNEEPRVKSFYANIDTGACFKRGGYGKLTALQYPEMTLFQQENLDVPDTQD